MTAVFSSNGKWPLSLSETDLMYSGLVESVAFCYCVDVNVSNTPLNRLFSTTTVFIQKP